MKTLPAISTLCGLHGLGAGIALTFAFGIVSPSCLSAAENARVAKTVPAHGDTRVDPKLKELRIEFDQAMDTNAGFSIVGGGETFPRILARPRWISDRILVTPIELKPNQGYWLSVNSSRFQNFKGANGKPSVPYPVEFRTAGKGEPIVVKPLAAKENRRSVEQLREAVDQRYSYRDLRGVDWGRRFEAFSPRLIAARSRDEFARTCGELLGAARDMHVWITADGVTHHTHQRSVEANLDFRALQRNVPKWTQHSRAVFSGQYPGGVTYLLVSSWSRNLAGELEAIHPIIDGLAPSDKLILDMRGNSGGDESIARALAERFVEKSVVYAKNRNRDASRPGGFTKVYDRRLTPSRNRKPFHGRIAVLTGPVNMSSCEAFLLMMRRVPNCKLIGGKTYGSSGNPKPAALANGVTVYLPSWEAMDADGNVFEGKGISPDIQVDWVASTAEDPVIEAALKYLQAK